MKIAYIKSKEIIKGFSSSGSSSDDDNETLANLVDQMKSGKQNTAAKSKLQGGASTQRRGKVAVTIGGGNLNLCNDE